MIRILLSVRLGERRWTQSDLARKTGIRPSTINEMYHELCERVNLEHLDLIFSAPLCALGFHFYPCLYPNQLFVPFRCPFP